jgi:hypothetical protein
MGLLVFTNKRLLFIFIQYPPMLGLEIPLDQIGVFLLGGHPIKTGLFSSRNVSVAYVRSKSFRVGDEPLAGFSLPNQEYCSVFMKQLKNCLETYEEEHEQEKQAERRVEVVQYNIVTKFEFGKNGGLTVSCPHCNAALL